MSTPARTVLVVDDDPQIRVLVRRLLEPVPYACAEAEDVGEAQALLDEASFAAVVCDVDLPGGSGIELAERLGRGPHAPAMVMLTGLDDHRLAERAVAAGAFGYLVKPFKRTDLLAAVESALAHRARERAAHDEAERLSATVSAVTAELAQLLSSLSDSAHDVRRSWEETIHRFTRALDFRNEETGGHVERVSAYCGMLAEACGLGAQEAEDIRTAAPMHDIGKIAIPDRILLKPEALTPEERREMQRHAELGHRILTGSGSALLELGATIAWTHHERWDGAGYPRGLRGTQIPLAGRIAAVADVYDALTSDRVYRPALGPDAARELMQVARGRHFDPELLDAFFADLPALEAIRRHRVDAVPEAACTS